MNIAGWGCAAGQLRYSTSALLTGYRQIFANIFPVQTEIEMSLNKTPGKIGGIRENRWSPVLWPLNFLITHQPLQPAVFWRSAGQAPAGCPIDRR